MKHPRQSNYIYYIMGDKKTADASIMRTRIRDSKGKPVKNQPRLVVEKNIGFQTDYAKHMYFIDKDGKVMQTKRKTV